MKHLTYLLLLLVIVVCLLGAVVLSGCGEGAFDTYRNVEQESYVLPESGNVTLCHVPPGCELNEHTIIVDVGAVHTHLRHGDDIGECDEVDAHRGHGACWNHGVIAPPEPDIVEFYWPEVCDGLDNDGDGVIDNDTCWAGAVCLPDSYGVYACRVH